MASSSKFRVEIPLVRTLVNILAFGHGGLGDDSRFDLATELGPNLSAKPWNTILFVRMLVYLTCIGISIGRSRNIIPDFLALRNAAVTCCVVPFA